MGKSISFYRVADPNNPTDDDNNTLIGCCTIIMDMRPDTEKKVNEPYLPRPKYHSNHYYHHYAEPKHQYVHVQHHVKKEPHY